MFTNILIFYYVFVLLEHFAINMNGLIRGFPFPSHVRVLVGDAQDIQEVGRHVEIWKSSQMSFHHCSYGDHQVG
jgi:hypothetical protein